MLKQGTLVDDLEKAGVVGDPENWTDLELLESSLGNISNTLSRSLSKRRTIAVYFKWLEVHRQNPSNLTRDWNSTLLHWSKALKARGFEKDETMIAMIEWKGKNGTFESAPNEWEQRRYPPMSYDIAKAWVETKNPQYHNQVSGFGSSSEQHGDSCHRYGKCHAMQNFEGIPPGDYVCNRCGTPGHFLQACPTNMKASYDKAPNMDYKCTVCHEYGLHYKSLCPLNTDPFSIIQKRRAQSPNTSEDSGSGILRDWQREIAKQDGNDLLRERQQDRSRERDSEEAIYCPSPNRSPNEIMNPSLNYVTNYHPNTSKAENIMKRIGHADYVKMCNVQSDTVDTADISMMRTKVVAIRRARKRTRAFLPDDNKIRSRREVNENSPSPSKFDTIRKKIRQIESYEAWAAKGGELEDETKELIAKKQIYQARLIELKDHPEPGFMGLDYGIDSETERQPSLVVRQNTPSSKRLKHSPHDRPNSASSAKVMDIDREERKPKIVSHGDFIMKFIERYPEMKEVVNPGRSRKTAMEMWDEDDDRRMKLLTLSCADKFPSFGASESDGNDYGSTALHYIDDSIDMMKEWEGDKGRIYKPLHGFGNSLESLKENLKQTSDWP